MIDTNFHLNGLIKFIKNRKSKIELISLSVFLFSNKCFAQDAKNASEGLFNILDKIEGIYYETSSGWLLNSEVYAKKFLIMLAVIDIIVIGMKHVLKVESIKDVFNDLIWKIIFIAGFLTILQCLPTLTDPSSGFLKGFEILGSKITGVNRLSPTGIIDTGLEVVNILMQQVKNGPITAIFEAGVYLIAAVVIIYSFITIAVELITTKIEAYILMFGGCFFLSFAGSKFTKKYAVGYLTYSLTVGIKLFIAYLVVAVGVGIGESVAFILNKDPILAGDYQAVIVTVIIFVIYATIAKKVSAIANGFLTGMTSMSSADLFATAGATAATTAAIATGGRSAAPGSVNGLMGSLGMGLGKAAGSAMFKGAGHAHAAMNSMSVNAGHNIASGAPIETAAPKAAAQTLATAAKNVATSFKDGIKNKASDIYRDHSSNIKSSPFSEQKMPPPPNKSNNKGN